MAADLVIRPRLVWRVMCPALAVTMAIAAIAELEWAGAVGGAAFLIPCAVLWREQIVVHDMVAYQRGLRWRASSVDLRRLASARIEIVRSKYPQEVLTVTDQAGELFRIGLVWHGNWRDLLCLIGHAADSTEAVLDGRTADRISRACPDWHRGATSSSYASPPGL